VSEGDLFDWRLVNMKDVHLSGAAGAACTMISGTVTQLQ
jgi:hypothetical protein